MSDRATDAKHECALCRKEIRVTVRLCKRCADVAARLKANHRVAIVKAPSSISSASESYTRHITLVREPWEPAQ